MAVALAGLNLLLETLLIGAGYVAAQLMFPSGAVTSLNAALVKASQLVGCTVVILAAGIVSTPHIGGPGTLRLTVLGGGALVLSAGVTWLATAFFPGIRHAVVRRGAGGVSPDTVILVTAQLAGAGFTVAALYQIWQDVGLT